MKKKLKKKQHYEIGDIVEGTFGPMEIMKDDIPSPDKLKFSQAKVISKKTDELEEYIQNHT